MAWNGSGTFNRITTSVSPAVGLTTLDVADQNSYTADTATGINACLAKNGENAATANLDMGGYKHTAVADGTALTEYASLGQVQNSASQYAVEAGAADVYVISPSPAPTAYAAGQTFRFKASAANTGACTLNVTGASGLLGAKNIKTQAIADPPANAIVTNGVYTVVYDGTQFQIQAETDVGFSVVNTAGTGGISAAAQVPWATEIRDPGGNFASNAYTCPTDGVYQFNALVTFATLTTANWVTLYIYKDGALYRAGNQVSNDSGGDVLASVGVSISDAFSAGDVITIWAAVFGGASEDLLTTSGYNYFNGHRVNLG